MRLVPKFPGAKTKNLFLRDKKGRRHFLVTVPHDIAVDLDALGAALGVGGVGFASAERLQKYLGITPGSVSLLGARQRRGARRGVRHRPRAVGSGRRARASARQHGDDGRPARRSRALSRGDGSRAARDRRPGGSAALTRDGRARRSAAGTARRRADPAPRATCTSRSARPRCCAASRWRPPRAMRCASSGRRDRASRRCFAASTASFRSTAARSTSVRTPCTGCTPTSEMIALRKDVSIVFQQYNLFPHKTALQNMMMAPVDVLKAAAGRGRGARARAAEEGAPRRQGERATRASSPAGSSSGWRSRARWRCGRR